MTRKKQDSPRQKQRTKSLWENDEIQFARLLCEMVASHSLSASQWEDFLKDVARSMDLEPDRVNELFERANTVFEKSKRENCP